MNFLVDASAIKLTQIIADTKQIHYLYLRRLMDVKLNNQKGGKS